MNLLEDFRNEFPETPIIQLTSGQNATFKIYGETYRAVYTHQLEGMLFERYRNGEMYYEDLVYLFEHIPNTEEFKEVLFNATKDNPRKASNVAAAYIHQDYGVLTSKLWEYFDNYRDTMLLAIKTALALSKEYFCEEYFIDSMLEVFAGERFYRAKNACLIYVEELEEVEEDFYLN